MLFYGVTDPLDTKDIDFANGHFIVFYGELGVNIYVHPDDNLVTKANDIALLRLPFDDGIPLPRLVSEIDITNRICLTQSHLANPYHHGVQVLVAGYGNKHDDNEPDYNDVTLTQTEQVIDTVQTCSLPVYSSRFDAKDQFCLHNILEDNSAPCMGDSGSPVVYYEIHLQPPRGMTQDRAFAIGVITRSKGKCGQLAKLATGWRPRTYAMKVLSYIAWIDLIVSTHDFHIQ